MIVFQIPLSNVSGSLQCVCYGSSIYIMYYNFLRSPMDLGNKAMIAKVTSELKVLFPDLIFFCNMPPER